MTTLQYNNLFAGCGGLSTGLRWAGWQGVFAVERNEVVFFMLRTILIKNRAHFVWPAWHWDIPDDFARFSEPRVMTLREWIRPQISPHYFEFNGRKPLNQVKEFLS